MENIKKADTIPKRLKYWAEQRPDKEAFVFVARNRQRTVFTCKEIFEHSRDFARHLMELGVEKGSYIAIPIPDSPQFLVALFGSLLAGCVVQHATIHLTDGSFFLQNLNKTKCRTIVLSHDTENSANNLLSQHFVKVSGNQVSSATLPYLKNIVYTRDTRADENVGYVWGHEVNAADGLHGADIKADDFAMLLISSGTTGISKLIPCSHFGVLFCADTLWGYALDPHQTDVNLFDAMPLNWAWGFPYLYLHTGFRRVLFDQRYISKDDGDYYSLVLNTISSENCRLAKLSIYACIKIMALLRSGLPADDPGWPIEGIYLGGQPVKKESMKILGTVTKSVCNMYSASETNVISSNLIHNISEFRDFNAGTPISVVSIKVVDEEMLEVPVGDYGQILVKSPAMFKGYFGDEELTLSSFTEDGYFCTKDYGCLTEEGELIVQGRISDVIMRGEHYFHPSWIESVIRQCPGVVDVLVVKVPDEALLNEICACVISEKGSYLNAKNVKKICQTKFLKTNSDDKTACPKYFLLFESFPVNNNGKYDRQVLEEMSRKLLGLD